MFCYGLLRGSDTGTRYAFYGTQRNLYRTLVANFVSNAAIRPETDTPHLSKQMDQCLTLLAEMVEDEKRSGRVKPAINLF